MLDRTKTALYQCDSPPLFSTSLLDHPQSPSNQRQQAHTTKQIKLKLQMTMTAKFCHKDKNGIVPD